VYLGFGLSYNAICSSCEGQLTEFTNNYKLLPTPFESEMKPVPVIGIRVLIEKVPIY
jgi:hypothetical protein